MYRPGDSYHGLFTTSRFDTGAATDADSTPVATITKNGVDDGAVTITVTNIDTGRYKISCTIPNTYTAGDVCVISAAATVNSVAGKGVVDSFRLVAVNLADAVRAGLTALPNASAGGSGGVPVCDASSRAPAKVYAYDTGVDPASMVLATPANKLSTNASGQAYAKVYAYDTGQDPATLVLATPSNKLATTATGQAYAKIYAYDTGVDPASLLLATPANKLATDASGNVALSASERTSMADAILTRSTATAEATAPAFSLCTVICAMVHSSLTAHANKLTVFKSTGSELAQLSVVSDAAAEPLVSVGG